MKLIHTFSLCALAAGLVPAAEAAVVVNAFAVPLEIRDEFFGHNESFDLDGNGTLDFTFGTSVSGTALRTERANRAIIELDPPPNIGGPPIPIQIGYAIGPTLDPMGFYEPLWASSDFTGGFVTEGENAFMGIVYVSFSGSSSSFNGRAPIGVEFESAVGTHYGYLDISAGPGYAGITFYGWAWETTPNTPIIAGSVPEPGRGVLLLGGIISLLRRRRV
jgi:hypothetical protein